MPKYALGIAYHGKPYSGWQRQGNAPSVQAEVEAALQQIAEQPIELYCAGRTDKGVHASEQVVHFATDVQRPDKAWVQGVNTHLPQTIRVKWVRAVPEDFHARFSATHRRYQYFIRQSQVASPFWRDLTTWFPYDLDVEAMHNAAQCLLGEQDFSAFRSSQCESSTPYRFIHHVEVERKHNMVRIDIMGNAFLHHMVRNIVGTLLPIGQHQQPVDSMAEILAGKDRRQAGPTAPPEGLYLVAVGYPKTYDLPLFASGLPIEEWWYELA